MKRITHHPAMVHVGDIYFQIKLIGNLLVGTSESEMVVFTICPETALCTIRASGYGCPAYEVRIETFAHDTGNGTEHRIDVTSDYTQPCIADSTHASRHAPVQTVITQTGDWELRVMTEAFMALTAARSVWLRTRIETTPAAAGITTTT